MKVPTVVSWHRFVKLPVPEEKGIVRVFPVIVKTDGSFAAVSICNTVMREMMARRIPPPQQLRISRCGDTLQSALVFTHTASKVNTFDNQHVRQSNRLLKKQW